MKSIKIFIGIIISIIILAQSVPAAGKQIVIHHPNPEIPLQKRWEWALQEMQNQAFNKGVWIGYSIEKLMGKGSVMGYWSDPKHEELLDRILQSMEKFEGVLANRLQ